MKLLKLGCRGNETRLWQSMLNKLGLDAGTADGIFGRKTKSATIRFQLDSRLSADGIVGKKTFAAANKEINKSKPISSGSSTINNRKNNLDKTYPSKPSFRSLYGKERDALFGGFDYSVNSNGSINILGNWSAKNIHLTIIPQLTGVKNPYNKKPISGKVYFHRKIKDQMRGFFMALEKEGLHKAIHTWGGSFVPRLVRGSSTNLSNHSFGTAFDINMEWNGLGREPALANEKGSVRELVSIANKFGLFWGGHYKTRKDGMHFEIAKIL